MNGAMKKAAIALAISGIAGIYGVAQAAVLGDVSHADPGGIRVGASTYPASDQGSPGAGVDGQLRNAIASTSHFANTKYRDEHGVYDYSGRQLVADGAPGPGSRGGDHSKLGVWSFSQAGSEAVWFGEWNAESATGAVGSKTPGTHTVWYVGESKDVASTLPIGSPVRYMVRSINNYTGAALPTSTLTANFALGTARSTGDIAFSTGAIKTVNNDVRLTARNVSVASSSGTGGNLDGRFFGTGAAAVAGMVKFADRNRDTAFGGAKIR